MVDRETDQLTIAVFAGHRTEKLADPLERTGEDVIVISDTSSSLLTRAARVAKNGHRQLQERDVDIVVGDHAGVVSFVAALLSTIRAVPFVLRLGGNIWAINREKLREHAAERNYADFAIIAILMLINRVTFGLCSGYLAISKTVKRAIVENTSTEPSRIGIVGVPLNATAFENASPADIRSRLDLNEGDPLLITVTNLRFRAKYEALRDSLPRIRPVLEANKDLHFVVAGDGMYLNRLRSDLEAEFPNGIRDRVHCPGFVDDIAGLYAAADAMVYVSYAEGFGNIIQEAMAAGCPVVANDYEGLSEQIDDGETGLLVTSPSDPELTDAIERLLYSEERDRIIDNAQDHVHLVSDPAAVGRNIAAELRELHSR